jgi:hypothetical protein
VFFNERRHHLARYQEKREIAKRKRGFRKTDRKRERENAQMSSSGLFEDDDADDDVLLRAAETARQERVAREARESAAAKASSANLYTPDDAFFEPLTVHTKGRDRERERER